MVTAVGVRRFRSVMSPVAIKFLSVGEKQDALEEFNPEHAGRILGMGDVVGLVEKAAETIEADEADRLARRMAKGQFDMNDFLSQLRQLKKMAVWAGCGCARDWQTEEPDRSGGS